MIRVVLPHHLQVLAGLSKEVEVNVEGPISVRSLLDALEAAYPVLKGTIRDHGTLKRRAFLRFFADGEDISLCSPDSLLSDDVASGREPFMVVGAIAGG
jgi:hypothetical protein